MQLLHHYKSPKPSFVSDRRHCVIYVYGVKKSADVIHMYSVDPKTTLCYSLQCAALSWCIHFSCMYMKQCISASAISFRYQTRQYSTIDAFMSNKVYWTSSIQNCIEILILWQSTQRRLWVVNQLIDRKSGFQYNFGLTKFRANRINYYWF